jgi:hypothetical protein
MTIKTTKHSLKLINFNAPRQLIDAFDQLLKYKGVSRTSQLLHLINNFLRSEHLLLREDSSFISFMQSISETERHRMVGCWRYWTARISSNHSTSPASHVNSVASSNPIKRAILAVQGGRRWRTNYSHCGTVRAASLKEIKARTALRSAWFQRSKLMRWQC